MIRNIEGLLDKLYKNLRDFTDLAIVGMSGGADSALVATLCAQALGPEHVWSLHMPYGSFDWEHFNVRSWSLATRLGVHRTELPINEATEALVHQIGRLTNLGARGVTRLTEGNTRARVRMALLYGAAGTLAATHSGVRCRVIGTGNLSEDYIGYDTKGGDALADIFPIGELFKSEVYQLLDYFRDQGILDEEHIDRVPSAGLWAWQTDEEELGYTYAQMEPHIRAFMSDTVEADPEDPCARFVWDRHIQNAHKHAATHAIILRPFCE